MALFESSYSFTWELADCRQVQSRAKRLQLYYITLLFLSSTDSLVQYVSVKDVCLHMLLRSE